MTKFIMFTLVIFLLIFAFHPANGRRILKPNNVECDPSLGEVFSDHAPVGHCAFDQYSCINVRYRLYGPAGGDHFNNSDCPLGPGCVCPHSLVRESDEIGAKCVPEEKCQIKCDPALGEVFSSSAPVAGLCWQQSCHSLLYPPRIIGGACVNVPACICPEPLVRENMDVPNAKCVPKDECCNSILGEMFSEHALGGECVQKTCADDLSSLCDPNDGKKCPKVPGCVCPEHLVREHKGSGAKCVPMSMCGKLEDVGKV